MAALYADKPVFDAPGFTSILAGELVQRLTDQAALDPERLILGTSVETIATRPDPSQFRAVLSNNQAILSRAVVLATGGAVLRAAPAINGAIQDEPTAVDTARFETACSGIFAVGDGAAYPGKLRLILSAFHEAALATQALRQHIGPRQQPVRRRSGGRQARRQP